jgi:hypothetical protein
MRNKTKIRDIFWRCLNQSVTADKLLNFILLNFTITYKSNIQFFQLLLFLIAKINQ